MRRILVLNLILLVCLFGSFCSKSNQESVKSIPIVQSVDHPAFDELRNGIIDGMKEYGGYVDGQNVKYSVKNAQGDQNVLTKIADILRVEKCDLIFALGTQAAQVVKKKINDKPIVFGAVTDPVAAGLVQSINNPGGNITGTSDKWPIALQVKLILEIVPKTKVIGIIYNAGEANSVAAVNDLKDVMKQFNLQLKEQTVTGTNDVNLAVQSLLGKCDVIYIPADNTAQSAAPIIIKICNDKDVPLFTGLSGIVEQGALATVGTNYFQVGKKTGQLAVEILKNGKKPSEVPVSVTDVGDIYLNLKAAKEQNVSLSEELIKKAFKVYK
jgi:putative ABC transport system substrate-binding protein